MLPILEQRVEIRKELYSHETGSKVSYLEIMQAFVEAEQEMLVQRSRANEAKAALAALIESEQQPRAEFERTLYGELTEAKRKAAGLREDVVKATQRTELQFLTSPVDGVVQQLAVHTVGGVVFRGTRSLKMIRSRRGMAGPYQAPAPTANQRGKNWSMQPVFHLTEPKCRSTKT